MMFRKGQHVDYYHPWAGGPEGVVMRWGKGYRIVEPVSPYNQTCALIERIETNDIGAPFNAPLSDLRPTKVQP